MSDGLSDSLKLLLNDYYNEGANYLVKSPVMHFLSMHLFISFVVS